MLHSLLGTEKKQKIFKERDRMPIYESDTRDIMREDRYTAMVAEEE